MNSKGLQGFVVNRRTGSADKLVQRVKDGLGSQKYKEVNYDELKALALEKKIKGQEKYLKVKKLKEVAKHGKEQNILKQHKMAWKREFLRLESVRKKIEAEIALLFHENSGNEFTDQLFLEFEEYEYGLDNDFKNFKSNTTEPVWTLREDLQYLVHQYKQGVKQGMDGEDPQRILDTVTSVKTQQTSILEKLQHEQDALECDLQQGTLQELGVATHERRIQTGIPEQAFYLECPDDDLKCSLLQEFILIDQKYIEKLQQLGEHHPDAISLENGGWSNADHFSFIYCLEQYTHDLPNRRALYIDRMKRHFPSKTRADIVSHEEWWINYKYYHERQRDLINDWLRDRKELLNKIKVVFLEALTAFEAKEAEKEYRRNQRDICSELCDKVKSWREKKLQAMQLEMELVEKERQEEQRSLQLAEDTERKRRLGEKEQLKLYHDKMAQKRNEEAEEERKRLDELKNFLREQAELDKERVDYRDEQQRQKFHVKEENKRLDEERIAEKEAILEAIRLKVRPHVEGDLLRLWSDTEAVKQRLKKDEEYVFLQRPLYQINSFTSKQITADPRFKLEQRLRDAGVHENEYARQLLANTKPLREPRKDMDSTVFKQV